MVKAMSRLCSVIVALCLFPPSITRWQGSDRLRMTVINTCICVCPFPPEVACRFLSSLDIACLQEWCCLGRSHAHINHLRSCLFSLPGPRRPLLDWTASDRVISLNVLGSRAHRLNPLPAPRITAWGCALDNKKKKVSEKDLTSYEAEAPAAICQMCAPSLLHSRGGKVFNPVPLLSIKLQKGVQIELHCLEVSIGIQKGVQNYCL